MDQNPIKYSDLISPDDSIEKLITQLESLNDTYNGMANNIRIQAQGVAASLQKVSGATEYGRQKTKEASDDAQRLEAAYRKLDAALSSNAKEIARLNAVAREQNNYNKQMIKLGGEQIQTREQIAQASYQQLSAQYSLNKAYINTLSLQDREIKENKQLIETTKAIYDQMKNLQEATGKYTLNVGNYENAIVNAIGINSRWFGEMKALSGLFEGGFASGVSQAGEAVAGLGKKLLALLANPIVLTIAGIAAAFAALAKGISSSEENTYALQRVLAPFERILTGIVNVLQVMAGWLLKGVEGMDKLAMGASRLMEKLPLVGKAFKSVNDSLEKNIQLTKAKQELDKAERASSVHMAELARNVAKWRNEAEKTGDPAKRVKLLKMAVAAEQSMLTEELRLAKENLRISEAKAAQSQNDKETNDALAQARIRLFKAEENYYQRTMRMQSKIRTNTEKMNGGADGKEKLQQKLQQQEEQGKKELEEKRKIEDAKISLIEDTFVRERMTIFANYNRKIEDLKGSEGYVTQMTLLLHQQREQALADLFEKEAKQDKENLKKKSDAEIKLREQQEKQRVDAIKASERMINQQYDVDISLAELEDNENRKTQLRLEAEKKRLQALLALYEKDGKTLTQAEVQTLKNNIAAVDKELTKNSKNKDLYDMLGFNLSDEKKQAISDSFSYALDNLNAYIDAWTQAADAKVQSTQKEVDSTKSALDAEIEARNKGYASNVEMARKEYEQAKKNQEKAIKEQERAQKAQQAIQTIQQVSDLVTATALIWSQLGFPWAIPAVAVMWGSFAAAKIKAMQVTKNSTEQYGEGTVELLEGGSHASGNDIDLGRKKDGTRRRAEGGEFFAVVNKRSSRKYRHVIPDVIGSLNNGTFAQKYMRAYGDGGMDVTVSGGTDISGLSADVRQIREQGERSRSYDSNGNEILRYKNLLRRMRR